MLTSFLGTVCLMHEGGTTMRGMQQISHTPGDLKHSLRSSQTILTCANPPSSLHTCASLMRKRVLEPITLSPTGWMAPSKAPDLLHYLLLEGLMWKAFAAGDRTFDAACSFVDAPGMTTAMSVVQRGARDAREHSRHCRATPDLVYTSCMMPHHRCHGDSRWGHRWERPRPGTAQWPAISQ